MIEVGFWIFTLLLFPVEKRTPHHLFLVGLFTGTCGIVLLLGFQFAASATQGVCVLSGNPLDPRGTDGATRAVRHAPQEIAIGQFRGFL